MDIMDVIIIIFKDIIEILKYVFFALLVYILIKINHYFGIYIADIFDIDYNGSVIFISLGFVNNVTIVFTLIELLFINVLYTSINKMLKRQK